MKNIEETIVTVGSANGFSQTLSTSGETITELTDVCGVRKINVHSTESWLLTDVNYCLEFGKDPRPNTSDFLKKDVELWDLSNIEIVDVLRENVADSRIRPLFEEFINRFNHERKSRLEQKSAIFRLFSEDDIRSAMDFAVTDVTGRHMRSAFLDVLLEDFLKDKIGKSPLEEWGKK